MLFISFPFYDILWKKNRLKNVAFPYRQFLYIAVFCFYLLFLLFLSNDFLAIYFSIPWRHAVGDGIFSIKKLPSQKTPSEFLSICENNVNKLLWNCRMLDRHSYIRKACKNMLLLYNSNLLWFGLKWFCPKKL